VVRGTSRARRAGSKRATDGVRAPGRALALLLVGASLVFGCGEAAESRAGLERTETDSAGVRIVEYSMPANPSADIGLAEVLRLGVTEGPDELMFSTIAGGLLLPDGSFVVADRGASEVRRFSREGELLSRHGREGEGPGEFEYIRAVGRCGPDGFTVFDLHWALHQYDDTGAFVEQRPLRLEDGSTPYALACSRSGRFAVTDWGPRTRQIGLHTSMAYLRILGPEGEEQADLGERIGSERFGTPNGSGPHPFGASTHIAFDGEELIVADGTFFGYERWSPEGRLIEIVRIDAPPPDLDPLLDGYLEELLSRAEGDEGRQRSTDFVESLRPLERAAHFADMQVLAGRVLVQTQAPDESGPWFVFDDDGTPLGRLEVPEDGRLLDMSDDALLVAVRGALDVEQVVLYDLAGGTELETASGGG